MSTIRFYFEVGILAYGVVVDLANLGRAHGLDVQIYASGWLCRRGWFVATGNESVLAWFQEEIELVGAAT